MSELNKLLEEIKRLKLADEILQHIYADLGPYFSPNSTRKMSTKTITKIRDYFNFDDNE